MHDIEVETIGVLVIRCVPDLGVEVTSVAHSQVHSIQETQAQCLRQAIAGDQRETVLPVEKHGRRILATHFEFEAPKPAPQRDRCSTPTGWTQNLAPCA
jgi:hypothetical protein